MYAWGSLSCTFFTVHGDLMFYWCYLCFTVQDERQVLPPDVEIADPAVAAASHGIEVAVEFKPVEHPIEPLDSDQPVKCPLPEPSILNVSAQSL